MTAPIAAVDHFAGTGWSVACRWLGIVDYGVEIMPEAIRTRGAVGFRTIYRDVWSGLLHPWLVPFHDLYIASPPCQTFSVAGRGTGRKALEMVLALIASGAWKDPAKLRAAGADLGDDRTALVLTPLAHIWAHRPRLVALEQVPTVLPVWEAMADVLRGLGYSVWTGNLQAEQYGVPQTRKRAILMARLDGPVAPPVPTHSRYYSRDPQRLDPGVQKWVSMAEALGWGAGDPIALTSEPGASLLGESGAKPHRLVSEPAFTVTGGAPNGEGGGVRHRWALDDDGLYRDGIAHTRMLTADERAALQTYPTAKKVMGAGMVERYGDRPGRSGDEPAFTIRASAGGREPGGFVFESAEGVARKMRPEEAAALQTFPSVDAPERVFTGQNSRIAGGETAAYSKGINAPSPTVTSQARSWRLDDGQALSAEQAATLQTFPGGWGFTDRPAVTVGNAVGRGLIGGSGAKDAVVRAIADGTFIPSRGDGSNYAEATRISVAEAGVLQTFPVPFPFQGSKGKQFLQIGNAVPPLLAYAILSALIAPSAPSAPVLEEPVELEASESITIEEVIVTHSTSADFEAQRVRAVEKAERAFAKAEERLAKALDEYDRAVAAHEERGDGFFPESYLDARREAVLARKFQEAKRSALSTARAQMSAARLGDL